MKTSLPSLSGVAACAAMHKTNKNTATVKLMSGRTLFIVSAPPLSHDLFTLLNHRKYDTTIT